ncbi:MAG: acyl-CoA dehydrogenase family protein [Sinimarinibacterium flocculans]|uniref:acyl-CoA dehydrogenase family protein n=1 Tax=Sinimarinibacterium flocculans TaxID=985250 RepID=UPI003C5D24A9
MSLAHTDEQRLLSETLRRFLDEHNEFEHRRRRLSAPSPERLALWPGLAEMGVLGAAFDEASGGFAGDLRTVALVMSELGRALAVEPYLGCAVIAGRLLTLAGEAVVIGHIIEGKTIVVLAHDAGRDPFATPRAVARRDGSGYVLDGRFDCVRHADVADSFLLTAALDDDIAVFHVPKSANGLMLTPFRLMDAAGAAALQVTGLHVDAAARLRFDGPGRDAVHDALGRGLIGLAAEIAGITRATKTATFQYLGTRKQFGTVIGAFQALQHRAADMQIAAEEIDAMLGFALDAFDAATPTQRSALASSAKALADTNGRRIGHEAIQLHGGMGVSDELDISHYGRRLATIRAELGGADVHRLRFGSGHDLGALLALQETDEERDWRRQVRDFTQAHLPERIARKTALGLKTEKNDYVGWQKVLYEHGWFAGAWPLEHGGQGWSLVKQLIFAQESSVCGAPWISPYGVKMVGPVIYTYGNDAQKGQHLPGILSSDIWWCQGYSEPGAGSDLASLKTFAELDGDHYVVNGAKMWTTEAHWADWMHCLVRTDRGSKPQAGITFLLIDMKTPGIEIRPIVTIDGEHHTNALFLDNVRVPVANRVGEEGQGWGIAKFLLGNERTSIADTGQKLHLMHRVQAMAGQTDIGELLAARLADVSIQLLALCALERRYVAAWQAGAKAGADASILKVRGTEVLQAITEVALDIEGPMAAAHDPADLHRVPDGESSPAQQASTIAYEYLYGRCWSVFGGTNEIQRNLIARQVLGF